jgi:hypothetical protein
MLLKKSASGVLASLRGSTYRKKYASPPRSLRPCWTNLLNSLRLLRAIESAETLEDPQRFPEIPKDSRYIVSLLGSNEIVPLNVML